MNIIKFHENYPDEASCIRQFREQRDQRGVICPKCGGKEYYWLQNKLRYQCKYCRTRQSLNRNSHGAFKTAVSVLAYSHAFADR